MFDKAVSGGVLLMCLWAAVTQAELASTVVGAPPQLAANIQARLLDIPKRELDYASIDLRLERLINEPGQPITWGEAQVTLVGAGADNEGLRQVVASTPFVVGQLMHHGIYESYKTQLLSEAQHQGYANARFSVQRLQVDLNAQLALPLLQLETGAGYHLNRVEFFNTRIQERELLDSGYFLSADIRPQVDEANTQVDLHAYLKEEPTNRLTLGGGVATDLGVQAVFNWDRAIVNDLGHGLSVDSLVSQPIQNVAARYTLPREYPQNDFWEVSLAWQHKNNEDTRSHLVKSGVLWRTDREEIKRSVGVNLEYEQYEQGSAPRTSTTYILPVASWDKIEPPRPTSNGYRYGFSLEASSEYLSSDTDFLKASEVQTISCDSLELEVLTPAARQSSGHLVQVVVAQLNLVDASLSMPPICIESVADDSVRLCLSEGMVVDEHGAGPDQYASRTFPRLAPLLPDLAELQGTVTGEVVVRVDVDLPWVEGALTINRLAAEIPGASFGAEAGTLTANFEGHRALVNGTFIIAEISRSELSLAGTFDWTQAPWSTQLDIHTEGLPIEPVAGAKLIVDSDLRFSVAPDAMSLQGVVDIPSGRVDLSEWRVGSDAVLVSPDVEIVGETPAASGSSPLSVNIALNLGDDVQFRGFGLYSKLRGGIELVKPAAGILSARGTIAMVDGQFVAYGQNLRLESGRLEFNGPPANPYLRLRTHRVRTVDGDEVGIVADGPVQEPRIRSYSSAPMSEEERIYYLLTGQRLDQNERGTEQAMAQAAMTVGLGSANSYVSEWGEKLGIQGFAVGIEMGGQGQQAQVSGYFGPDLYIKYGYGLFEPGTVFSARYRLRPQLYLEGSQGKQSALNLLWYFRRRQDD